MLLLLLTSCTAFTCRVYIIVETKVKVDTTVKSLEYKHPRCSVYWMLIWKRR